MHSANLYLRIWNRIVLHGYKAIAMIQISSKEIWNRIALHGYKAGAINDLSRFVKRIVQSKSELIWNLVGLHDMKDIYSVKKERK